jgi:hypothetical protein
MITELDICRGIIEGAVASPTPWQNSSYVALRLSGTGVAYRLSLNEYVYRSPDIWLSAELQRRLLGVPIIIEHAPGGLMTSQYFGERCVGFVAASYVNDDERSLWGIARILDSNAIKIIEAGLFDTSPAILLPLENPRGPMLAITHVLSKASRCSSTTLPWFTWGKEIRAFGLAMTGRAFR